MKKITKKDYALFINNPMKYIRHHSQVLVMIGKSYFSIKVSDDEPGSLMEETSNF